MTKKTLEDSLNAMLEDKTDLALQEEVASKLEEASKDQEEPKDDAEEKETADEVTDAPAVSIDNPLDPKVASVADEEEAEEEKEEAQKSVKESVAELLGDEFDADFKLKATAIFEAAVKNHMIGIRAELEEEYASKKAELEAHIEDHKKQLTEEANAAAQEYEAKLNDKIDGYLAYIGEEWMKQNEVAIDSSIKTELTESFIMGMKRVFEEHYVDLPEEKLDLIGELTEKNRELEQSMSRAIMEAAEARKQAADVLRDKIITESVRDLTAMEAEKFKSLVEDFEYESEASFKKRAGVVRETFFKGNQSAGSRIAMVEELVKDQEVAAAAIVEDKALDTQIIQEERIDPSMAAYLTALKPNN